MAEILRLQAAGSLDLCATEPTPSFCAYSALAGHLSSCCVVCTPEMPATLVERKLLHQRLISNSAVMHRVTDS